MSGGQRQRLALARALLADFPILILDEPGEHLDTDTADALVADLLDVTRARATLLITHRLVGLEQVDEILAIEHGRIVERGTHTQLTASGGRYAAAWQHDLPASDAREGDDNDSARHNGNVEPRSACFRRPMGNGAGG